MVKVVRLVALLVRRRDWRALEVRHELAVLGINQKVWHGDRQLECVSSVFGLEKWTQGANSGGMAGVGGAGATSWL